jgi:hypothetical protein
MGTDRPEGRRGLVFVYAAAVSVTVAALLAFVFAVTDSIPSPEAEWLPTAQTTFNLLGVLASLAAIVAFVQWALQQRRRPELLVRWRLTTSGRPDDLVVWEPDTVADVPSGPVGVEVTVLNVGDASTTGAQSQFVALEIIDMQGPDGLGILLPDPERGMGTRSTKKAFDLAPGAWALQGFLLTVPDDPGRVFRLTFVMSDGRLNVTGRRLLPSSRLTREQVPITDPETPWPPPGEAMRWWDLSAWGRAQAQPSNRLLCRRGVRADVRDMRVRHPGQGESRETADETRRATGGPGPRSRDRG